MYRDLFKILVVDSRIEKSPAMKRALHQIVSFLRDEHHVRTEVTSSMSDGLEIVEHDSSIGCLLVEWDTSKNGQPPAAVTKIINKIQEMGLEFPIFLLVSRNDRSTFYLDSISEAVRGVVYPEEDEPDFLAKYVMRHFDSYLDRVKTPFFGRMIEYNDRGNEMWTCPGHNGGMFYRKSPIGRVFYEYLGEQVFRADIDNSVVSMGDLLIQEGPPADAEAEAAKIFGADKTFFVLNGTSTSNKMVNGATVSKDDLVLFDRNNHKSHHHGALVLAGGIPVYLPTDRNAQGLIGPIDFDALDEGRIRDSIKANPLVTDPDRWKAERPFRLGIIEQCSYDGTIYNVDLIREKLGPLCEYLLFDEAWAGFMKFHPLFANHYAMGLESLGPDDPGIVATQSTHKQLAGFSQASQIHIKDKHIELQHRHVSRQRFDEFYMVHASTSPFYPLFASLDVGAQMMKGRNGTYLWEKAIEAGIGLRKDLLRIGRRFAESSEESWFFTPFVPDRLTISDSEHTPDLQAVLWEDVPTKVLLAEQECWRMNPGQSWHGFTKLADNYVMTDPNKLTLLTPGFDPKTGEYLDWGVPAPILAQFLRERGIVPEKNDLNTILFLVTPGIEYSKAGTLVSALVEFKQLHDQNILVSELIPAFCEQRSPAYEGMRLQELCQLMHDFYRNHETSTLQREQFQSEHFPRIAMSPAEAMQRFTANDIDYVPIDEVRGRIAATLALVYPPGIGVMVPGEVYDERAEPMIKYLQMFQESYGPFPGFASEIQGVYPEERDGQTKLFTYVIKE